MDGDRDVVLGDDEGAPAGDGLGGDGLAGPLVPRSGAAAFARHPATLVVGGVALAFALGAGGGLLFGDDEPRTLPTRTVTPSPSPEPSPSTTAPSPAAPPSPSRTTAAVLDPSCTAGAPETAVCRFVLALQTGDLSGLTDDERALAEPANDLPDAPFAVTSCELEGDVTVLCEVQFADPERIAAGFRLQPSNGEPDPATGQIVVEPGQTLAYGVVETVGMRRDGGGPGEGEPEPEPKPEPEPTTAAPPPPAAPPTPPELVLGGESLGVTEIGAPADEAVRAISRVLGPPARDPATTVTCIPAEREVEWGAFRLAVADDRVIGWLSRDRRLRTPSGFGIGTTVAEMRRVLGDDLEVYEANPDNGPAFAVEGVDLGGNLTGTGPSDRVEAFTTSACSGP